MVYLHLDVLQLQHISTASGHEWKVHYILLFIADPTVEGDIEVAKGHTTLGMDMKKGRLYLMVAKETADVGYEV